MIETKRNRITIEVNEMGFGNLYIDQHDISDLVRGATIEVRRGELTRIILDLSGAATKADIDARLEIATKE